jgi:hypothetical protein
MPATIDKRAEQLRHQRANAEPHGRTQEDPRQDIAGTSDSERRAGAGVAVTRASSRPRARCWPVLRRSGGLVFRGGRLLRSGPRKVVERATHRRVARADTYPIRVPIRADLADYQKITCAVHSRRPIFVATGKRGIRPCYRGSLAYGSLPPCSSRSSGSSAVAPKPDRQRRGGVPSDPSDQLDARRLSFRRSSSNKPAGHHHPATHRVLLRCGSVAPCRAAPW